MCWIVILTAATNNLFWQAFEPQAVLRAAHKVCAKLGIDHATIQVQDARDSNFCFSKSCESHNPQALYAKSSCVLSNHLEFQTAAPGKN